MKIISNCPLCGERALHVVEDTEHSVDTQQCISCGYATSTRYSLNGGKVEDNEMYKQLTEEMVSWAKVANDRVWIPTIMTLPFGMLYPTTIDEKKELRWGYAKMVDIPKEEQKDYPVPGKDGEFYDRKYDTENADVYDEFYMAMVEITGDAKKNNETKKNQVKR